MPINNFLFGLVFVVFARVKHLVFTIVFNSNKILKQCQSGKIISKSFKILMFLLFNSQNLFQSVTSVESLRYHNVKYKIVYLMEVFCFSLFNFKVNGSPSCSFFFYLFLYFFFRQLSNFFKLAFQIFCLNRATPFQFD